jgi:hypothetical protein
MSFFNKEAAIPRYESFYKEQDSIDGSIQNDISKIFPRNVFVNEKDDMFINAVKNATNKPKLKYILFVDLERIICLYHFYELHPDLFHIFLFLPSNDKEINNFDCDLITTVRPDSTVKFTFTSLQIDMFLGGLHHQIKRDVVFVLMSNPKNMLPISIYLSNFGRKVFNFSDYKCKSFIYLFLHYIVTKYEDIIMIQPRIRMLIETISFENLYTQLKDVDDSWYNDKKSWRTFSK